MSRIIRIESCGDCPHKDHKGGFGVIAYVPKCRAAKRELPYTAKVLQGRVYAECEPAIPDWCPLESSPEETVAEDLRLRSIVAEVHAWILCAPLTDAEDMMENAQRIYEITAPDFAGRGAEGC